MDPSCRISKDISARKNTQPEPTHTAIEMRSVKAAHKAYLKEMTEGYEEKIRGMILAHDAEIHDLKAASSDKESLLLSQQQAAIQQAIRQAVGEYVAKTSDLNDSLEQLRKEKQQLSNDFNEMLEQKKAATAKIIAERNDLELKLQSTERKRSDDVRRLQAALSQAKNAWVEVTYKCEKRQDKTCVHKSSTKFEDAVKDLCKEKNLTFTLTEWSHKDKPIPTRFPIGPRAQSYDGNKTLTEV